MSQCSGVMQSESHHGEVDPGFGRLGRWPIVADETSAAHQPGDGAFNGPLPRLHDKAFGAGLTPDDFHGDPSASPAKPMRWPR